jgi:multiple sugar transport system ATP-binding protein
MVYVTHDQVEAMTLGERIAVLKSGVLQQIADPHTLYHGPVNQFVAGFIGSPPMNFLAAQVSEDGSVTLPGAAAFRPMPAPLASRRGKAVTLGVRPEDLSVSENGPGGSLPATLDVREPLGNEALLYWSTPAGPLVSRWIGESVPAEGQRATLYFRNDRLRWFDPETEQALS